MNRLITSARVRAIASEASVLIVCIIFYPLTYTITARAVPALSVEALLTSFMYWERFAVLCLYMLDGLNCTLTDDIARETWNALGIQ